jgi:allophanate hydrolase subunit 2
MIVIEKVALAIALDAGRFGHMHQGVPWGGPLVPELFVRANRAVGNADDAVALEVFGSLTVRAQSDVTLSTERADVVRLAAGDRLVVPGDPGLRVRYLAMKGGLTERGPLLKGERVLAGTSEGSGLPGEWPLGHAIRILAGPDEEAFPPGALELLCEHDYWIHEPSNRVGTRLRGPAVPRVDGDERPSAPMVLGAIQVPRDGAPIVLGPEHPTTGGYPILAVIASRDIGRFHSKPVGERVRFVR